MTSCFMLYVKYLEQTIPVELPLDATTCTLKEELGIKNINIMYQNKKLVNDIPLSDQGLSNEVCVEALPKIYKYYKKIYLRNDLENNSMMTEIYKLDEDQLIEDVKSATMDHYGMSYGIESLLEQEVRDKKYPNAWKILKNSKKYFIEHIFHADDSEYSIYGDEYGDLGEIS